MPRIKKSTKRGFRRDKDPNLRGNHFVEELPGPLTKDEFFEEFRQLPKYDERQRRASNEDRHDFLLNTLVYLIPLTRHYHVYRAIRRMIRYGYLTRRPDNPRYWREWRAKMAALKEDLSKHTTPTFPTGSPITEGVILASPFDGSMFGLSGTGKTTCILKILEMWPQLIEHGNCCGNIRQVVWIMVETSTQSSTKDMLLTIARAFDDVLGTSYAVRLAGKPEHEMLVQVINLCFVHALGVLVTDELQNLTNLKSKGGNAILGFLLRLANVSKTPILAIGTYEAQEMMKKMRMKRRYWRAGIPSWLPLSREEFEVYIKGLWKYQYTRTRTPLSEELFDKIYDECRGIPDYAARLYLLAQDWLISENDNGKDPEVITPALISQVAHEYLGPARVVLTALKERNWDLIKELKDTELPPIEEVLTGISAPSEAPNSATSKRPPHRPGKVISIDRKRPEQARRKRKMPRSQKPSRCRLVQVVGDNVGDPPKAYKALREAGFISSAIEFWEDE